MAHTTSEAAIQHAIRLEQRSREAGHRPLNVYRCPQSDLWHLGHRPTYVFE
jgi:hypothetical protein